jgi:hypothetical protein
MIKQDKGKHRMLGIDRTLKNTRNFLYMGDDVQLILEVLVSINPLGFERVCLTCSKY